MSPSDQSGQGPDRAGLAGRRPVRIAVRAASSSSGSCSAGQAPHRPRLVVVAGVTSTLGCWPCSVGSPNGTVTSAVCSTTIGCSPPHRWPTSASPANAEPGCACPSSTPSTSLDRFRPQAWGKPVSVPLGPRAARRRPRRRRGRRRPGRPVLAAHPRPRPRRQPTPRPPRRPQRLLHRPAPLRPHPARLRPRASGGPSGAAPASGARSSAPTATASGPSTAPASPFLVEYDNGTERLDRLAAKLDGYARLAAAAGHPNWVLFTFPGPRREAEARRVLAHPDVPVATAARTPGAAPDGAVWLPVDRHAGTTPPPRPARQPRLADHDGR